MKFLYSTPSWNTSGSWNWYFWLMKHLSARFPNIIISKYYIIYYIIYNILYIIYLYMIYLYIIYLLAFENIKAVGIR